MFSLLAASRTGMRMDLPKLQEENMKKLEQLYEGKAKKVFKTEDADQLIVDYKDDATAFNGEKKGTIVGKGVINNRMTNRVFQLLEKEGVQIG